MKNYQFGTTKYQKSVNNQNSQPKMSIHIIFKKTILVSTNIQELRGEFSTFNSQKTN
jgi:hypothetical protein